MTGKLEQDLPRSTRFAYLYGTEFILVETVGCAASHELVPNGYTTPGAS
jgi:hypothetical protein